jgi:Flp pilus assembly protein TadD
VGSGAGPGPAAAGVPAIGVSLWTLGPGAAPACEKVVDPPAAVTALSVAAGSRAWEKARGLLVLGDMAGAQRQMCTAVLNHPQSLALEGLAALYLTLRTPSEALRWVEQALGVRPDRPKTLELYGDVLVMLGRETEARKAWLSGLRMQADNKSIQLLARNLTEEADKALRSGDLPRAEQLARRAAGLDMTSARAAGTMAAVLLTAGQTELATRWTQRCVQIQAQEPSCLLAQGDLALSKGDLKTARTHYEKVTRLAPGDRRAWQKLGGAAPRQAAPAGEPQADEPVIEEPVLEEPTPALPE